jgi:hypothetical protein
MLLYGESDVQIKQIWKVTMHKMRDSRKECLHAVQLQHWGCHGDEHGLQRRPERPRFPSK